MAFDKPKQHTPDSSLPGNTDDLVRDVSQDGENLRHGRHLIKLFAKVREAIARKREA